jgi:hypothetical protein
VKHFEHNDHPVTQEQWRNYSQNRASIIDHPYLVQEAELLRRIGSNKRTTKEHLQTLSGRVCTMKDIHNLYARLKKKEEQVKSLTSPEIRVESILQQFVDKHVENHVSILSGDDGSNEAICLASKCMKELFQVFPQVIMVDCTVSSTTPDFNMHGFLSFDVVGNGKPIYLCHSLNTSASLFRRVCQDFKRTHPKWIDIKLMVLDKNIPEISILEQEFPDAKILLCQLSCIKFLGSLDIQNEYQILTPDLQDKVHNIVKQIILASSEVAYNASKNQLLLALGMIIL